MAGGTFDLILRGTWTLPASGDNDAVAQLQALLTDEFGAFATTVVSAVQSPIQTIPGQTTYDVSIEGIVQSPALTLADSLTKVNFKTLGNAVIKAGNLKGSTEVTPPA